MSITRQSSTYSAVSVRSVMRPVVLFVSDRLQSALQCLNVVCDQSNTPSESERPFYAAVVSFLSPRARTETPVVPFHVHPVCAHDTLASNVMVLWQQQRRERDGDLFSGEAGHDQGPGRGVPQDAVLRPARGA